MAALLQNASVTSTDFSSPLASLGTKSVADDLVISISLGVSMPHFSGKSKKESPAGGDWILHSAGMFLRIRARLSAARCSQSSGIVSSICYLVGWAED